MQGVIEYLHKEITSHPELELIWALENNQELLGRIFDKLNNMILYKIMCPGSDKYNYEILTLIKIITNSKFLASLTFIEEYISFLEKGFENDLSKILKNLDENINEGLWEHVPQYLSCYNINWKHFIETQYTKIIKPIKIICLRLDYKAEYNEIIINSFNIKMPILNMDILSFSQEEFNFITAGSNINKIVIKTFSNSNINLIDRAIALFKATLFKDITYVEDNITGGIKGKILTDVRNGPYNIKEMPEYIKKSPYPIIYVSDEYFNDWARYNEDVIWCVFDEKYWWFNYDVGYNRIFDIDLIERQYKLMELAK